MHCNQSENEPKDFDAFSSYPATSSPAASAASAWRLGLSPFSSPVPLGYLLMYCLGTISLCIIRYYSLVRWPMPTSKEPLPRHSVSVLDQCKLASKTNSPHTRSRLAHIHAFRHRQAKPGQAMSFHKSYPCLVCLACLSHRHFLVNRIMSRHSPELILARPSTIQGKLQVHYT